MDLWSTACKHYWKRNVPIIYNVMIKQTPHFMSFNGSIPLKYASTTTPPIIAHCENSDVRIAKKNSNFTCTPSFDLLPDKVSKRVSIIRRVVPKPD